MIFLNEIQSPSNYLPVPCIVYAGQHPGLSQNPCHFPIWQKKIVMFGKLNNNNNSLILSYVMAFHYICPPSKVLCLPLTPPYQMFCGYIHVVLWEKTIGHSEKILDWQTKTVGTLMLILVSWQWKLHFKMPPFVMSEERLLCSTLKCIVSTGFLICR